MIQETLWKARSSLALPPDIVQGIRYGQGAVIYGHRTAASIAHDCVNWLLDEVQRNARLCVAEWFDTSKRKADDLRGVYTRLNDEQDAILVTWTFSDRNTALLFKLSLK